MIHSGHIHPVTTLAIGALAVVGAWAILIPDSEWLNGQSAPAASVDTLYARAARATVTIRVKDARGEVYGHGSGFALSWNGRSEPTEWIMGEPPADGEQAVYVLTNHHVVEHAHSADVRTFDGDTGTVVRVVREDEAADLALLAVTVRTEKPLPALSLAAADPPVLTSVVAVGSPAGLSGSASAGVVSAYRTLYADGKSWLQTTAPISPGSSGSPLMLADGTIAGVVTALLGDAQNIGFAVPVSRVDRFLWDFDKLEPRTLAAGAKPRPVQDRCRRRERSNAQPAGPIVAFELRPE